MLKLESLALIGLAYIVWRNTTPRTLTYTMPRPVTQPATLPRPATVPKWRTPPAGQRFETFFEQATQQYNLPPGLLSRVAYQESRYRPDARSPAGAVGLMQIVPRWHPEARPEDPIHSIFYAAGYLRDLYNRFGTWPLALAAYNWGPTNITRKGLQRAPRETRNYVVEIMRDTGIS